MGTYCKVLLAEDDLDDYEFFVDVFEKISPESEVIRTKNGLDCITYLKRNSKPDLIFLDLNMPLKNGLECLKFVKESEELASIPVIIFSTSHYIKNIDACFKNGAHYYIVKPSTTELLTNILSELMGRLIESDERPGKQKFVIRIASAVES